MYWPFECFPWLLNPGKGAPDGPWWWGRPSCEGARHGAAKIWPCLDLGPHPRSITYVSVSQFSGSHFSHPKSHGQPHLTACSAVQVHQLRTQAYGKVLPSWGLWAHPYPCRGSQCGAPPGLPFWLFIKLETDGPVVCAPVRVRANMGLPESELDWTGPWGMSSACLGPSWQCMSPPTPLRPQHQPHAPPSAPVSPLLPR